MIQRGDVVLYSERELRAKLQESPLSTLDLLWEFQKFLEIRERRRNFEEIGAALETVEREEVAAWFRVLDAGRRLFGPAR
jgi:hypothetical protein